MVTSLAEKRDIAGQKERAAWMQFQASTKAAMDTYMAIVASLPTIADETERVNTYIAAGKAYEKDKSVIQSRRTYKQATRG